MTARAAEAALIGRAAIGISSAEASAVAPADFSGALIDWQRAEGRNTLPWQNTRDPYRVWLSEIMLQQTQVSIVLGYYARFLARFPDVVALAAAPLDDVLAAWSGLGYYSRARNLHACATAVMVVHGGQFPRSAAILASLPGIGRSTAAAIAAFCFGERVAILDGNVKRVLTRVLGFGGDLAEAAQERALWAEATRLLPTHSVEAYTQGLMDLGATVCTPRAPSCLLCPVLGLCVAVREGDPQRYPVKTRKMKRRHLETLWLSLAWRDRLWLVQRPLSGIWPGLWSLPEFESITAFESASRHWPGTSRALPAFTHVLTHLDWRLNPVQHTLPNDLNDASVAGLLATVAASEQGRWFERDQVPVLALPAALRKVLPAL